MENKKSRIMKFLNSNLGLWLLSTVAVGFFSFSYTELSARSAEQERKSAQVTRLKIEIAQRVAQYVGQVKETVQAKGFDPDIPNENIVMATLSLLKPPSSTKDAKHPIYAAFDEYKDRPVVSLLVELDVLLEKEDRMRLTPSVDQLSSFTPGVLAKMSTKEIDGKFKEMFVTEFWKDIDDY
ncbi:MAG TPA: hypothetical protein DCZ94_00675 [Lentisphaeria bacterium]|nr:MAG: hypothetical protein A2X48_12240 [Lentisphaerae bacterium GWF2_49_21]HBC85445.1 hypothetical protein [Lentisphaeria bacterium]